jgi:microsomal epoxide hydrolase
LEAGQGQAIVFIPGWLLPAQIWKAQLDDLSQDFHVIALDPRSQGESDITPQGDEPLRQAQDIQELLDYLQLTSVVLVGWSHGGFQVLAYMGEFGTDRLYAAVLVDSALGAASSNSSTASQSRFLDQFKTDRPKAVRSFVWGLFKNPPPGDFLKELDNEAVKPPTDIALALMNNAFPGDRWQPSLKIMNQVPLLYAVTPKYTFQANYLTQVDPLARVEIFQNSGHALFFDESDHFNALMRDFIRQASLYPAGLPEPLHRQGDLSHSTPHPGLGTAALAKTPTHP